MYHWYLLQECSYSMCMTTNSLINLAVVVWNATDACTCARAVVHARGEGQDDHRNTGCVFYNQFRSEFISRWASPLPLAFALIGAGTLLQGPGLSGVPRASPRLVAGFEGVARGPHQRTHQARVAPGPELTELECCRARNSPSSIASTSMRSAICDKLKLCANQLPPYCRPARAIPRGQRPSGIALPWLVRSAQLPLNNSQLQNRHYPTNTNACPRPYALRTPVPYARLKGPSGDVFEDGLRSTQQGSA